MKQMLIITMAALLCGCGCSTTGKSVPLQPGDTITFKATDPAGNQPFERAAEFRTLSGNDPGKTSEVVTITAPTQVKGSR